MARSTMARIFPKAIPRGRYFTPYLSIGDDIETGLVLRLDRQNRRVVLGFRQERLGDAPQLAGRARTVRMHSSKIPPTLRLKQTQLCIRKRNRLL